MFALDAAMGDVVRTTTEPGLGAIRLAWWRERLEALDKGEVPAEPRLQAAADQLLPHGLAGLDLAALEGGWLRLLEPFPWDIEVAEAVAVRGRHLFALAGRLLGHENVTVQQAGALWALADAARHCSDATSRTALVEQARIFARGLQGARFAKEVRPLTLLAALAARDSWQGEKIEPEATPGRAAALLRHRLTGRLPAAG